MTNAVDFEHIAVKPLCKLEKGIQIYFKDGEQQMITLFGTITELVEIKVLTLDLINESTNLLFIHTSSSVSNLSISRLWSIDQSCGSSQYTCLKPAINGAR